MPFELYFMHEIVSQFVKIFNLNNWGEGNKVFNNETDNKKN